MGKVGIFGGTFNPIHWGHLLAAEAALDQVPLDCILWVPSLHSPYKTATQSISFHHRAQMVERAIDFNPQFILPQSILALASGGSSSTYAIDTLKTLQHHYGLREWYWILGLDAFRSLPRWVNRNELVPQCFWLIAPRWSTQCSQHEDRAALNNAAPNNAESEEMLHLLQARCQTVAEQLQTEGILARWQLLSMPLVQVSSSLVRQYAQQGRSIQALVPEAVQEYIATHRLYGK